MSLTVENVRNARLCCGCGTCVAICPNAAIKMKVNSQGIYVPAVDSSRCTMCGFCIDVCPGRSVDNANLNEFVFGKSPDDFFLGNCVGSYIGHSADEKIRWDSSSGGLVTTLLVFALEEGIIDGALVTRMSRHDPLEAETIIARTQKEIISASGSKYCPVPANIQIREILKENGKFAVVGVPCHISGIRKVEMLNGRVREKIILHLGLFCSASPTFLGTEFFLNKLKVKREEVAKMDYRRGKGWPGGMTLRLKNGNEIFTSHSDLISVLHSTPFRPLRCLLCNDQTSELADLSFGDAWLPELKGNRIGESIVISRSQVGEKILYDANSKKKINVKRISNAKVLQSQKASLRFKKKDYGARVSLWRLFGLSTPNYGSWTLRPSVTSYVGALLCYVMTSISLRPSLLRRSMLNCIFFLAPRRKCMYRRLFRKWLSPYWD